MKTCICKDKEKVFLPKHLKQERLVVKSSTEILFKNHENFLIKYNESQ